MGVGDKIDDEQYEKFDEFVVDVDLYFFVVGNVFWVGGFVWCFGGWNGDGYYGC